MGIGNRQEDISFILTDYSNDRPIARVRVFKRFDTAYNVMRKELMAVQQRYTQEELEDAEDVDGSIELPGFGLNTAVGFYCGDRNRDHVEYCLQRSPSVLFGTDTRHGRV